MLTPGGVFFVTSRTVRRMFALRPSPRVNDIVGGILARAVQLYNIDLYAYGFTSNHFHMTGKCETPESYSRFVGYVKSNIARKIGAEIEWDAPIWSRRYDCSEILDDEALVERFKYIAAHGVKEGLVETPLDWPGLTSVGPLLAGVTPVYHWYNYTKRGQLEREAKAEARRSGRPPRRVKEHEYKEPIALRIAPLPCWEGLTVRERSAEVKGIVEEIIAEGRAAREADGGRPVMGAAAVLRQDPHSHPRSNPPKRPRPLCHARHIEERNAYRERYKIYCAAFFDASARHRRGELAVEFPDIAFRPVVPPQLADAASFSRAPPAALPP